MSRSRERSPFLANTFGSIGYVSLLLQWLWTTAIFLPSLLENETFKRWVLPEHTQQTSTPVLHAPPFIVVIIGIVVTVFVLIVTIIVIARLPGAIVSVGKRTTNETAEKLAPVLAHHQTVSSKKKRLLKFQLVKAIKLLLITAAGGLLGLCYWIDVPLDHSIVILVGCLLAMLSLVSFCLQYIIARLGHVPGERLI